MRCIICNNTITRDDLECPNCGESLMQWFELDDAAANLLHKGLVHLRDGNDLLAVLNLAKAAVLNPDDPVALKAIGITLARQEAWDEALYYLERASAQRRSKGLSPDEQVDACLAALQDKVPTPPSPPEPIALADGNCATEDAGPSDDAQQSEATQHAAEPGPDDAAVSQPSRLAVPGDGEVAATDAEQADGCDQGDAVAQRASGPPTVGPQEEGQAKED